MPHPLLGTSVHSCLIVTFDHLLCTRKWTECFCTDLTAIPRDPTSWVLLFCPFYRQGGKGLERLGSFLKVTHLIGSRAKI